MKKQENLHKADERIEDKNEGIWINVNKDMSKWEGKQMRKRKMVWKKKQTIPKKERRERKDWMREEKT